MKIHPHSKFVFIGDSITDCGRWQSKNSLGNGYVNQINALLQSDYSQMGIDVINKGISGDTIRDLNNRWEHDVLAEAPDWLSIMIGINDVWQQLDNLIPKNRKIFVAEYEHTLDALIASVSPLVKGLVLMTPYYLQLDRADPMRAKRDSFGAVVQKLAKKYEAIFVDTQAPFDENLQKKDVADFSTDRVHINLAGHKILAKAFLNAVK